MRLDVLRYSSQGNDSLGLLFVDGVFECYTLEDEFRDLSAGAEKVMHETRIPEGTYEIGLRTVGGMHRRYLYHSDTGIREIHKGMLWVRDVPHFQYVLIHCGNDEKDTSGCLLVGSTANNNRYEKGFIGESRTAYKRFYPRVVAAIERAERVIICYRDKPLCPSGISPERGET